MAAQEIKKKQLKQDVFRKLAWQTILWAQRYNRLLLIGSLCFLLLIAIGSGYFFLRFKAEQKAGALLARAETLLRWASPASSQEEKVEEAIKVYQEFLERFPQTRGVEEAFLRLGNLYYHLGRYEEAIDVFKRYLETHPRGSFAFLASLGLGYAYEGKGNMEGAAQIYEQAIKQNPTNPLRPEALLALARIYEVVKKEEAPRVYEKLIEQYPRSSWAETAYLRLSRLKTIPD